MKNIRYSYYLRTIVVFLLCISSFTSCIYDDVVEQEEHGLIIVKLGFDEIETRAAGDILFPSTDAEITKVRIFVFVGEHLEVNRLFTAGQPSFNNPFVLDVVTGPKDIYVVANESPALSLTLATVTTKSGLTGILADQISSPLTLPLPMLGSAFNVSVIEKTAPDRNSITIPLTRIAAKISLRLNKANPAANVKITKVTLLNNAGKSTLYPIPPATAVVGQSYWNFSKSWITPIDLTTTLSAVSDLGDIYVYENLDGSAANKTNATQLELEALYNNISTTYRVYINENVSSAVNPGDPGSSVTNPNDHLYKIKRGHQYNVDGTIVNLGEITTLEVKVKILPWTVHQYKVPLQ